MDAAEERQQPVTVRIAGVSICDFRAFPGPEVYRFDLGGKNLLLWGENGSGKTSFFRALQTLLAPDDPSAPFAEYKNRFSSSSESAANGAIVVELPDFTPSAFDWRHGEDRPTDQAFLDMARRATFLDYKALVRAHTPSGKGELDLFDLIIQRLLRYVQSGATSQSFLAEWESLRQLASAKRPAVEEDADPDAGVDEDEAEELPSASDTALERAQTFHAQLATTLSRLEKQTNDFLTCLLGPATNGAADTSVHLPMPGAVSYEEGKLTGFTVALRVTYGGQEIDFPSAFLNEARLSAVAIALYLAAALLTPPLERSVGETTYRLPRLLVLDDILIGLDLSHRLPLLDLLKDYFSDWQIILTTHDRVWFELARQYLNGNRWEFCELFRHQRFDGVHLFDVPRIKPTQLSMKSHNAEKPADYYLVQARAQLADDNWRAAAMYTRVALEEKLKTFCENKKISVKYSPNKPLEMADFLGPVKAWLIHEKEYSIHAREIQRIELYLKRVLNPMSHFQPLTLARIEVEQAIDVVRKLDLAASGNTRRIGIETLRTAYSHFTEVAAEPTNSAKRLELTCQVRSAFETELWEFCTDYNIRLPLSELIDKVTTETLWNAVAVALPNELPGDETRNFVEVLGKHQAWLIKNFAVSEVDMLPLDDVAEVLNMLFYGEAAENGRSMFQSFKGKILKAKNRATD